MEMIVLLITIIDASLKLMIAVMGIPTNTTVSTRTLKVDVNATYRVVSPVMSTVIDQKIIRETTKFKMTADDGHNGLCDEPSEEMFESGCNVDKAKIGTGNYNILDDYQNKEYGLLNCT